MELGPKPCPSLYVSGDKSVFTHTELWLDVLKKVSQSLLRYQKVALQVRLDESDPRRLEHAISARQALDPAIQSGLPVFLNGTIQEAREMNYPGVHLKEKRLQERLEQPGNLQMSVSTHSLKSIQTSLAIGASFCVFGPVYPPMSKNSEAVGTDELQRMTLQSPQNILALGGLTPERVGPCIQAGAKGVACISSVMLSHQPAQTIQAFMKAMPNK